MKNKLSLLGILNEASTTPKSLKKTPFNFNFSHLRQNVLDDLINDIQPTLGRNTKLKGLNSLEKIIDYTSKNTNNLKKVINLLLVKNIINYDDISKILTDANPTIVDDIENSLAMLTDKNEIARVKTQIRTKFKYELDAVPDDAAEYFIEKNRIKFRRNMMKSFTRGILSFKGSGLFLKKINIFNRTPLSKEENRIVLTWFLTGVGNFPDVWKIVTQKGNPTKYAYALSHMSGQIVQKYFFWNIIYFVSWFLYEFWTNFFSKQKYSTKDEGFASLLSNAYHVALDHVGLSTILPISIFVKFFWDNSPGGTITRDDMLRFMDIAKNKEKNAETNLENAVNRVKKVDVTKKITAEPDTTTTTLKL
jgi:hypothetical protein